jgi:hypothetical protein
MNNYETFVQRAIECETPSLDLVLRARQQFVDESNENVLQDQLVYCLKPFIDQVSDEQVPYWGLVMCSLFEIHISARALGVAAD